MPGKKISGVHMFVCKKNVEKSIIVGINHIRKILTIQEHNEKEKGALRNEEWADN